MFIGTCAWAILPDSMTHTITHIAHNSCMKMLYILTGVYVRECLTPYARVFNLHLSTTPGATDMKFSNLLFCCSAILVFGAWMGAATIGLALFTQVSAIICLALND